MYKGPGTRTSRTQAEKIGTNPAGFENSMTYFAQGGHPVTPATPAMAYTPSKLVPGVGGKPIQGVNFKIK